MPFNKCPKLSIRGKNELAKHIAHDGFSVDQAKMLIDDVVINFDRYWKDNLKRSKPADQKWVRSAKGTPLGTLLGKINERVLAPHDKLIPNFVFGGLKRRNHVQAAKHLLGMKRKRTLLKLDLSRFFEQITEGRVISFLINKCNCTYKGAKLLARLCCVPLGEKGSNQLQRVIARGFATSSRIAVWCSMDTFVKMDRLVQRRLRGKDPRIAIYVDDIGITSTRTEKSDMLILKQEIKQLVENGARPLLLNDKKCKVVRHEEGMEFVGLGLDRNSVSLGVKTRSRKMRLKNRVDTSTVISEKKTAGVSLKGISQYEAYIKKS